MRVLKLKILFKFTTIYDVKSYFTSEVGLCKFRLLKFEIFISNTTDKSLCVELHI